MSEPVPEHVLKNTKDSLMLIYLIYGAGALTLGFTTILGVVWLFLEKKRVDEKLQSHVTFLIDTFWKCWVYLVLAAILSFFVLGIIILIFWFFWLIIRCVKGFRALKADRAILKPKRWLF